MEKIDKKADKNSELLILQAAEIEFMLKGFQGAKTTSIAKSAGVTHAMLHYYYRTKENLFNKVFEEKVALVANTVISSFGNHEMPLLDRVKLCVELHFDFLVKNPDLPRFLINELISQPSRQEIFQNKIQSVIDIFIPMLQKELDDEAEKGVIEKINAFDLIFDIVSINIFIFIALPIFKSIKFSPNVKDDFLENRKHESVEVIMRRLKK